MSAWTRALRAGVAMAALAAATAAAAPAVRAETAPVAVRYVQLLQAAVVALPSSRTEALADVDRAAALTPTAAGLATVREVLVAGDDALAQRLLQQDIAVLTLPRGVQPGGLDDALRRLDGVYARPPLDRLDQPHHDTLLDRLGRFIGDLLDRASGGNRDLVRLLGALALAALAFAVVRNLRSVSARAEARIADDEAVAGSDPDAEWFAALAAAERGDHREAVRRAFRSALLAVAVRGRLFVDPAWTSRELLAATRADADLLATLAPAAAAFDLAWYSGRPVAAADWELQRQRCATVRELATRRAPSPRETAP